MGIIGTVPAAGRVILVGDAAGLVNPLQGEGISHAPTSGRDAGEAILAGPGQAALLPYPELIGALGRALTYPPLGRALAGGWSIFWNELHDGASPIRARATAAVAGTLGGAATARTATRRWFDEHLPSTLMRPVAFVHRDDRAH